MFFLKNTGFTENRRILQITEIESPNVYVCMDPKNQKNLTILSLISHIVQGNRVVPLIKNWCFVKLSSQQVSSWFLCLLLIAWQTFKFPLLVGSMLISDFSLVIMATYFQVLSVAR